MFGAGFTYLGAAITLFFFQYLNKCSSIGYNAAIVEQLFKYLNILSFEEFIMKVRCTIEGLDCPHCALELANKIAAHADIATADINFAMKSLVMEVSEDADEEAIVATAQGIADDFENGITIELRD